MCLKKLSNLNDLNSQYIKAELLFAKPAEYLKKTENKKTKIRLQIILLNKDKNKIGAIKQSAETVMKFKKCKKNYRFNGAIEQQT